MICNSQNDINLIPIIPESQKQVCNLLIQNLKFIRLALLPAIMLVLHSCAKPGMPTGGVKDITPPVVVESNPEKDATKFEGDKITITFNKFVQLKDLIKAFVISPPMKKKPEIVIRGKSVVVRFMEDLKPNTTYRLYFGDAIVDLHESNPLRNYDFVFSTGDYVDSLSLRGRVLNAFDDMPNKDGIFIMLYNKFQDSIPRKQLPMYITKANSEGWFTITNIKPDSFMIFALKDLNQNYLFDNPSEAIAFSDTIIHISTKYYLPKDSLSTKLDTMRSDSLRKVTIPFKPQVELYSFVETNLKQYLKKYSRSLPERIDLLFNNPLHDTINITPLNFKNKDWLLKDHPIKNDTLLTYWITDTSIIHNDTLKLKITYPVLDSLANYKPKNDTVKLVYRKPKPKGRASKTPIITTLQIDCSCTEKPNVDLNDKVYLYAQYPISAIEMTNMYLYKSEEAKKIPVKFKLVHDSVLLRRYEVKFPLEPGYSYSLTADSAAFTSLYQLANDSISWGFKTQRDDYYGTIKLTVANVHEHMILQLMNDKDNLVTQKIINKDQLVVFDFLAPGKYKVKAIYDTNKNKIWDTGNFKKKIQPERVLYFKKELSIRSNWDDEEKWTLE